jgi:hypothetical protein
MPVLKVSLKRFLSHLADVKKTRPDWPHIDEVGWLLRNFKFSDTCAVYERDRARGPPLSTTLRLEVKKTSRQEL